MLTCHRFAQRHPVMLIGLAAVYSLTLGSAVVRSQEVNPAAAALETIFSPNRIPTNRSMGLVQRNFLDLIEESKSKLQVAIVLDATSSMQASLDGIKQTLTRMMDDLQLYEKAEVGYQLVVFRDSGSDAGEIEFPIKVAGKNFMADRRAVLEAIQSIDTQSGAPYFHELIDLGIHEAIQQLNWSTDNQTSRWLLVVGDAPPFESGFSDAETGARRRYETRRLAALATAKSIRVNCILCTSRSEELTAYQTVLDQTRQFMSEISSETGGLMLDLSYPDIRKAILAAAGVPRTEHVPIGTITRTDVEDLRQQAEAQQSVLAETLRARIAILPHLPLDEMTFRADRPAVRLAADMRRRFRGIPGLDVKSARVVRVQFERLFERGLRGTQLLQMLASALRVDYVVWGNVTEKSGLIELDSAIFRRDDGRQVVAGHGSKESLQEATAVVVAEVINTVVAKREDAKLTRVFSNVRGDNETRSVLTTPVSNVEAAISPLLEAYDLLEQISALNAGDPNAEAKLNAARKALDRAVAADPDNPIGHQLLANCCFNQAQAAERGGDAQLAQQEFATAKAEFARAKSTRNQAAITDDMKIEIMADYALLGQRNTEEAVQLYSRLVGAAAEGNDKVRSHMALRAHWMLAGIRAGDWGAADAFADAQLAREHLTAILAHWPDSPQATYIRGQLRWDHQKGANAFQHYPHQGPAFLDTIE